MTYTKIKSLLIKILYIIIIIVIFSLSIDINKYVILCLGILTLLILIYSIHISKIVETTLCLIVKNDNVLMMLRNKKKNDVHKNKYNGLGGRVEKGESKEKCILREVNEEAGIILTKYNYVGKVIFKNFGNKKGKEIMYCFIGYDYENEIGYCNEGDLEWIDKNKVMNLPLWDGDKYFLLNIIENKPFKIYLHYENDKVIGNKVIMK